MDLQTMINTPVIRVRLITFVHFSLLVNAMLHSWPDAYLFYNILFMVALFWSIHSKESIDAVHTAIAINVSSFFFDLICIIGYFPYVGGVWSIIFAIINVAVRPFTVLLLHKELVDRGGDFVLIAMPGASANSPRNYEDMDRNTQSVPHSNSATVNINNLF